MKKMRLLFLAAVFALPVGLAAQITPPPPVPVTETEIRDDSIKMRSAQLERIKRDAKKPLLRESAKEREIRFGRVKKDFENIQKLQDKIIRTYTTGKQINYAKIGRLAADMNKDALRLHKNLFGAAAAADKKTKEKERRSAGRQEGVRSLIIDLDKAIGKFVGSPIFNNLKVVDLEESKKARLKLIRVIDLSRGLSAAADEPN